MSKGHALPGPQPNANHEETTYLDGVVRQAGGHGEMLQIRRVRVLVSIEKAFNYHKLIQRWL